MRMCDWSSDVCSSDLVRGEVGVEVEDGQVVRLLGIIQDITDHMTLTRNLVETESRRRELLHRLLRTSEHQRAELAGDLHDGPIQMLTVAAMRLEHLGMVEDHPPAGRSEEHTSELQSLKRNAYAGFCLK